MRKTVCQAILLALACASCIAHAAVQVTRPQVERRDHPLGIDSAAPRFSWQTEATPDEHGILQVAYRIVVSGPGGQVAWDSGRVEDGHSLEISYRGVPLRAEARYAWQVTAWYADGRSARGDSWFETGLLDPTLAAWEGAQWIGGNDADRVLYSQYLPLYELSCVLAIEAGSSRAGLVFAANDKRLMDRNRNIFQLQGGRDASYFKVELDVSGLAQADGLAKLNVYRAGYRSDDDPARPVKSLDIRRDVIDAAGAHSPHRLAVHAEYGELTFRIDGVDDPFTVAPAGPEVPGPGGPRHVAVILNPARAPGTPAHDVITYGMLGDIGFAVPPGQKARASELVVSNIRKPANAVFHEDLAARGYRGLFSRAARTPGSGLGVHGRHYTLDGGRAGLLLVADPSHGAMPMLRTTFSVAAAPIVSARLYATARGIHELYLNGQRVGDDHYSPGLSQYNRTQYYQSYDVTGLVRPGRNALGAMLGEGWWSGLLSFGNVWNHFGDRQSLLAKLVLTHADGKREVVTSDPRLWKAYADGPIRYSSLTMGEVYDATRERAVEGWSTAEYDDRSWHAAVVVPLEGTAFLGAVNDMPGHATDFNYDGQQLLGQPDEPARAYQLLRARGMREVRPGVYVYDLGQNIVGVPRVHFGSGIPGRRVFVRFAEMLYPDLPASGGNVGMVMTENYRAALSQDQYVMRAGAQDFQPRFTSHGFQYIEITGLDAPLPVEAVGAVAISSVQSLAAQYETSDADVNRLWSNIGWSNVDNFLSIPTDCPQRNERMGWSGDISVFSRTATYLSGAGPFLERHMHAMRDSQLESGKFTDIAPVGGGFGGVLWGSAGITVPWELYQQYGDLGVLRDHYAAMVAYANYLESVLDPSTGFSRDAQLGDWLGPQNQQLGQPYLATAYQAYDLRILAQVARLLGRDADAGKYDRLYRERRAFFNRSFVDEQGRTRGFIARSPIAFGPTALEGEMKPADTQTSYAVGLALGLFEGGSLPLLQKHLAESVQRANVDDAGSTRAPYSLMTGFIGTAWISQALSDSGHSDLAYRLLLNHGYPSWLYPVGQGATTIWERLNGYTREQGFGGNNSMNSFNHYSFGAVGQWLVSHSLGIQRGEPGFREFMLQPEPDPTGQLRWAKGHYDSPYGRIESGWILDDGALRYDAAVPANAIATLVLPATSAGEVTIADRPASEAAGVTLLRQAPGQVVYRVGSGSYRFTIRRP
jgi:alpha-L-rhamnosidase